ncbi:hypothetical protein GC102_11765 [Paenibacillus sp. LMG 31460]|uniref:Secreted protein n=1 Tax=Paenibacillus germinis TaxID=2654979 RepID=A0ABX1YZ76_9BACL|nr:hypothetical protein [Paenibacillus germinis]NOU86443.1 hypothetical protein [Paenibacillus germinis]
MGRLENRWRWCAAVFFAFGKLVEEMCSHGGGAVKAETMFFIVKVACERARVSVAIKNIATVAVRVPNWLKCVLGRCFSSLKLRMSVHE